MSKLMDKIFKNADQIQVTSNGVEFVCKGLITPYKKSEQVNKLAHETGFLSTPKYLFMGTVKELNEGDTLRFENKVYRVINSEFLKAFGKEFCMRAVLEVILE